MGSLEKDDYGPNNKNYWSSLAPIEKFCKFWWTKSAKKLSNNKLFLWKESYFLKKPCLIETADRNENAKKSFSEICKWKSLSDQKA